MVYANIIRPKEYTFFLHNLVEGKRLSGNCWSWSFWQSLQASWSPSSTSLPLFCQQKKILIWALCVIWCILSCVKFLLTQCNSIWPKIWHLVLRNLWTTPCRCFTCFTWWLIRGMMPFFEFLLQKPHNGWKTEPWNVADGRLTSMKLMSGCIIYMLATPSKLKILGPKAMVGLHNIRNKPKLQKRGRYRKSDRMGGALCKPRAREGEVNILPKEQSSCGTIGPLQY